MKEQKTIFSKQALNEAFFVMPLIEYRDIITVYLCNLLLPDKQFFISGNDVLR